MPIWQHIKEHICDQQPTHSTKLTFAKAKYCNLDERYIGARLFSIKLFVTDTILDFPTGFTVSRNNQAEITYIKHDHYIYFL